MHFPAWDIIISWFAALMMSVSWMPKFLMDRMTTTSTRTGDASELSKQVDPEKRSKGTVMPGSELHSTDVVA